MDLNTKTVSAKIYMESDYFSQNLDYQIIIPQGLLFYRYNKRDDKINHLFSNFSPQKKHGKVHLSYPDEYLKDIEIPTSLIDNLVQEFEENVSASFGEASAIHQENADSLTKVINLVDKQKEHSPLFLFSSPKRYVIDSYNQVNRNDQRLAEIEKNRQKFYFLVQELHDKYIRN